MKPQRIVWRNVSMAGVQEPMDIVIEQGKIAELLAAGEGNGDEVLDCSGQFVSSGWIDLHVHAFAELEPYGDEIDEIGVKQGVTTIVDAGSCGADQIDDLAASRATAKTNLLALLNVSKIGLKRVDELSNMAWIDLGQAVNAVQRHPDFIVGLKARMSGSVIGENGLKPLIAARELSVRTGLPLMVHIGSKPPGIEGIVPLLADQDVITHYLNGKKNRLFDDHGKPLQVLADALKRGVQLDVGHGTASFSFEVAEAAKANHVPLHTISTDIYRGNRLNGPVYNLSLVLTKFLHIGYALEEVIAAVTSHAAAWLRRPELGRIQVGEPANLTLYTVTAENVELVDSEGVRRTATQRIQAKGAYIHGQFIEC
ncbi:amidohydrolase/deacetylase family metallohydrolase [Paenibacillus sp. MMS18-CY102]|uniref:amidohydrolase/deacetylase family metallohydrolase n=1 Tax=Paenibacillus sp. MMS18-CY102 TaxID=2682849 RepID=UPI00136529BE|nr:amidohydrolase/deacetylase family metallohydrolase [Paenibacillus sp. MMS18-CY102]MWC28835.1 amidohydrolase/deacetylase family metallohydrolase [Paenibacillus sp. MMS18-CY102]